MKLSVMRLMGPRDLSMLFSIRKTMLGPCLGHIRAMFWLFLQYICLYMTEMAQNFTKETCMPNGRILLSVDLLGPYWGYVLAILGPYFGYFCNIYMLSDI